MAERAPALGPHNRTAYALDFMRKQDIEATGQLPAPYRPRRTRGLGKRAAIATGKGSWVVAKATGKAAWWLTKKAFAPGEPAAQFEGAVSTYRGRGVRVIVIETYDRCISSDVLKMMVLLAAIILFIEAIGG